MRQIFRKLRKVPSEGFVCFHIVSEKFQGKINSLKLTNSGIMLSRLNGENPYN